MVVKQTLWPFSPSRHPKPFCQPLSHIIYKAGRQTIDLASFSPPHRLTLTLTRTLEGRRQDGGEGGAGGWIREGRGREEEEANVLVEI